MTTDSARKGLLIAAIACSLLGLYGCSADNGFIIDNHNEYACSAPAAGTCLVISDCPYVLNIIKTQGVQSPAAQQYLRGGSCGYEGLNPKVCCPTNDERDQFGDHGDKNQQSSKESTQKPLDLVQDPLSLLPTQCGQDFENRIVGGEATELGEFPWMVVIEFDTARGVQTGCGGALISKRYVLTAAHCIRAIPSTWRLSRVRLGEYNLRTDPDCQYDGAGGETCADPVVIVPVEREIVHENYMNPQKFHNDIALLRLSRDVRFTSFIQPICLPTSGAIERNYWSAGWGQIERRSSSDVKLKVNVPSFDFQQCARLFATKNAVLGHGQMCAGGVAGKDTCKGDSGGPLMKQVKQADGFNRWVVDGVVSFGQSPCGLPGWPAVYTKVNDYVPWIHSKLGP